MYGNNYEGGSSAVDDIFSVVDAFKEPFIAFRHQQREGAVEYLEQNIIGLVSELIGFFAGDKDKFEAVVVASCGGVGEGI